MGRIWKIISKHSKRNFSESLLSQPSPWPNWTMTPLVLKSQAALLSTRDQENVTVTSFPTPWTSPNCGSVLQETQTTKNPHLTKRCKLKCKKGKSRKGEHKVYCKAGHGWVLRKG